MAQSDVMFANYAVRHNISYAVNITCPQGQISFQKSNPTDYFCFLIAEMGFVYPVCFCVVARRLRHSALPTRNARHRFGENNTQFFPLALPFPSPKVMKGANSLREQKRKTHREGVFSFLVAHVGG